MSSFFLVNDLMIRVGLSPSIFFIYVNGGPLKMMKNVFYFRLKDLFVLEPFTFLYRVFGCTEKWLDTEPALFESGGINLGS